jgi:hypothetical protein
MKDLMYVLGEPGVGKSTFVEYITRGIGWESAELPVPFRRYDCGVWELGKRRREYSGTDALAMNAQPAVEQLLEGVSPALILAEGDRLANAKFFHRAEELGYTLHTVTLLGSEIAAAQRTLRGSKQDESWLRGRQTKVRRLSDAFPGRLLQAGMALHILEDAVHNPVMDALRNAREGVE